MRTGSRWEYFGAKREEVEGGWRRLYNEELHNLYASPNIIRVIKSRRLRLTEHVARTAQMRNAYKILVGKPAGKIPLERSRCTRCTMDASGLEQGQVAGYCEHGNEPSGYTKGGDFFD
jgi:hypothetical protein